MKYDLINTVCEAAFTLETTENRSAFYKALSALAYRDINTYKNVLSEFANSEKTEKDYNKLRIEVMGAPLPPKPTASEVVTLCLNGQYGCGARIAAEYIKNNCRSKDLMATTIVTLMKSHDITVTKEEILAAVEEL